ncbi:MAG: serine acetyltransferase [Dehalococcoidia bacterium]|nr:serine acetyltransferase [Dehalococcoidia bacterium]
MKSFQTLVIEPFREDIAAWEQHAWPIGRGPVRTGLALLRFNGLRATLIQRLAFWACSNNVPFVPTILTQANVTLHGIEIPSSLSIGPGLYMPHTVGSVVTALRIGRDVTIQGGVTIGMRNVADFPAIEDGVEIGTGARVLGPLTLGAGCKIGANAVVMADVPPGCTAVGVPARILHRCPEMHETAPGDGPPAPCAHPAKPPG